VSFRTRTGRRVKPLRRAGGVRACRVTSRPLARSWPGESYSDVILRLAREDA
jgi:hypothetical protein